MNSKLYNMVIFVIVFFTINSFAQKKNKGINYQATVMITKNGKKTILYDEPIKVKFSIMKELSLSNIMVVYEEEHDALTNSYGVFNLTIGRGTPIMGKFGDIDWSDNNYLRVLYKIKTDNNWVTISMQEFSASPIALSLDPSYKISYSNLPNEVIKKEDIIDDLFTEESSKPLSAKQGKVLKGLVDTKVNKVDVVDALTSTDIDKPLSANQGKVLLDSVRQRLYKTDVVDDLKTSDKTKALSANQGKVLAEEIDNMALNMETTPDKGKYLYLGESTNFFKVDKAMIAFNLYGKGGVGEFQGIYKLIIKRKLDDVEGHLSVIFEPDDAHILDKVLIYENDSKLKIYVKNKSASVADLFEATYMVEPIIPKGIEFDYKGDWTSYYSLPTFTMPSYSNKIINRKPVMEVIDNLKSTDTDKPLSANQGKALKDLVDTKVNKSDVVNNLTSTDTDKPLSANQGKILNEKVKGKIDTLSIADNLTTNDARKVLSAKQGKVLDEKVKEKIDTLSIVDNLTTNDAKKVLSAKQGKVLDEKVKEKIDTLSIADNLTTNDAKKVLSAKQGKVLDEKVKGKIDTLSIVDNLTTMMLRKY